VGQSRTRTAQKPALLEDPLADLRDADDDDNPAAPTVLENGEEEPEAVEVRALVTQETWDEMVSEAVAAWHQDPTSQGFLHGGGACGCFYIARHALRAAVPVAAQEDVEELAPDE
jgi:hypothetical protein